MIMGVLDLGPAAKFNYLPTEQQMQVVDIHLFLADHMRFEMMLRLNKANGRAGRKRAKEMRDRSNAKAYDFTSALTEEDFALER